MYQDFKKLYLYPNLIKYCCFHFVTKWHVFNILGVAGAVLIWGFINIIEFIIICTFKGLTVKAPLKKTPYQLDPSLSKKKIKKVIGLGFENFKNFEFEFVQIQAFRCCYNSSFWFLLSFSFWVLEQLKF